MNAHRRRRRADPADERGVSLVELLIAISITGIIMVPIGGAIFFGFRATSGTQTRLEQSNHANVLASYFVPDVQGAVTVAKGATDSAACGGSGSTADLVLTTNFAPPTSISYYRGQGANQTTLFRRTCSNGVPSGVARVVDNLQVAPAFTCIDANGNPASCATWGGVSVTVVQDNGKGEYLHHHAPRHEAGLLMSLYRDLEAPPWA